MNKALIPGVVILATLPVWAFGQTQADPPVTQGEWLGRSRLLPAGDGDWAAGPADTTVWGEAEYLLWWFQGGSLPPLATASPAGTPVNQAGVPGTPGVSLVEGGSQDGEAHSGFRLRLGIWLEECQDWGVEGSFFTVANRGTVSNVRPPASGILARPFFNAQTNQPDSELVAYPGVLDGGLRITTGTPNVLGAEGLVRARLCGCCDYRWDVLAGYRFARYDERLNVEEALVTTDPTGLFVPGTTLAVGDQWTTKNQFHGGEIGSLIGYAIQNWTLELTGKVAFGDNRQTAILAGGTQITVPGFAPVARSGGLLVQASNAGRYERDVFACLPEVGLRVGCQVTSWLRASVGYDLLYWSEVLRSGPLVDLSLNPSQLPPGTLVGPARPAFGFTSSDFWMQGLSFGLEARY